MKVRCINVRNLPITEDYYLTLGEVYKVIKEDKRSYKIITNNGMQVLYNKERFEIVEEDNKMQEKTFREVIADIKEGEVWESVKSCFQLKEISCISGQINFKLEGVCIDGDNNNSIFTGPGAGQTFKLQRKEYTFEEAFKAYEEGKVIESCYSQFKYKRANGVDLYSRTENNWYEEESFEIDEIRGKWYINN